MKLSKYQWISLSAGIVTALIVVVVPLLLLRSGSHFPMGHAEIKTRLVSPDSKHVASIVWASQGALGNHSNFVVVDRFDQPADPERVDSAVFASDNWDESLNWESPTKLRITYKLDNPMGRSVWVSQAGKSADGLVDIVYSATSGEPNAK
jgi:hypothetical protein